MRLHLDDGSGCLGLLTDRLYCCVENRVVSVVRLYVDKNERVTRLG